MARWLPHVGMQIERRKTTTTTFRRRLGWRSNDSTRCHRALDYTYTTYLRTMDHNRWSRDCDHDVVPYKPIYTRSDDRSLRDDQGVLCELDCLVEQPKKRQV